MINIFVLHRQRNKNEKLLILLILYLKRKIELNRFYFDLKASSRLNFYLSETVFYFAKRFSVSEIFTFKQIIIFKVNKFSKRITSKLPKRFCRNFSMLQIRFFSLKRFSNIF